MRLLHLSRSRGPVLTLFFYVLSNVLSGACGTMLYIDVSVSE